MSSEDPSRCLLAFGTLSSDCDLLLSRDGLATSWVHLLVLLHDSAQRAEEVHAEVAHEAASNAFRLAHLAAHHGAGDVANEGEDGEEAAEDAVLAHRLGHFAHRVAGQQPRDDAHAAVVEAAATTVLPLARHDDDNWLG